MAHPSAGSEHHGHHIVPQKTLFLVFGILLFLTALTVYTATQFDFGRFDVPLALAIAGTKAAFVVTVFMALKWDSPVNRLAAGMGVLFVSIFLTFTLFDTLFRGDVGNVDPQTIMDMERAEQEMLARETPAEQSGQPGTGENVANPGAATVPPADAGLDSTGAASNPAPSDPGQAPAQPPGAVPAP